MVIPRSFFLNSHSDPNSRLASLAWVSSASNVCQLEALVLLPFGECDQRGRGFPLRPDRATPIIVAACRQHPANGRKFFGRATRRRYVSPTGCADRFRVMHQRFGVSEPIPREPRRLHLQRGSGLPIVTLKGPARRRGCKGIGCGELVKVISRVRPKQSCNVEPQGPRTKLRHSWRRGFVQYGTAELDESRKNR